MAEEKLGSLPAAGAADLWTVSDTDLLRRIVGDNACCADVETIVASYR